MVSTVKSGCNKLNILRVYNKKSQFNLSSDTCTVLLFSTAGSWYQDKSRFSHVFAAGQQDCYTTVSRFHCTVVQHPASRKKKRTIFYYFAEFYCVASFLCTLMMTWLTYGDPVGEKDVPVLVDGEHSVAVLVGRLERLLQPPPLGLGEVGRWRRRRVRGEVGGGGGRLVLLPDGARRVERHCVAVACRFHRRKKTKEELAACTTYSGPSIWQSRWFSRKRKFT